jgi:hypothetical protein
MGRLDNTARRLLRVMGYLAEGNPTRDFLPRGQRRTQASTPHRQSTVRRWSIWWHWVILSGSPVGTTTSLRGRASIELRKYVGDSPEDSHQRPSRAGAAPQSWWRRVFGG